MSYRDETLLPDNASPIERGLEAAFASLLALIDPPFPELFDTAKTPAKALPYLAADRGVDEWKTDASEAEKRDIVAAALPTKRMAGKREALLRAVESIGFAPTIKSWREGLPPYSFTIVAQAPEEGDELSQARYERLEKRLNAAKSERDVFELLVETFTQGEVFTAAALETLEIIDIYPE
ncbi:MAG: phage tail protein I [Pseudomonadota bacterium]|nr:phage tail protein I [Pseudomonadota bacterium]